MYHEWMIPQIEGYRQIARKGPFFYILEEGTDTVGEYRHNEEAELVWLRDLTTAEASQI